MKFVEDLGHLPVVESFALRLCLLRSGSLALLSVRSGRGVRVCVCVSACACVRASWKDVWAR